MAFWATAEAAIAAWVLNATGLPAGHVIWANQRIPTPVRPYARLKRISHQDAGGIGAELRVSNTEPEIGEPIPIGEEVTLSVIGRHGFTVSIQIFASATVGDAQATMTNSSERTAVDYMRDAELALNLPSVVDALSSAGLVAISNTTIKDLPDDKDGTWISRAQMDVQFNYTSAMTERVPAIEQVKITGTFS